jgi:hypothetical protein
VLNSPLIPCLYPLLEYGEMFLVCHVALMRSVVVALPLADIIRQDSARQKRKGRRSRLRPSRYPSIKSPAVNRAICSSGEEGELDE